MVPTQHKSPRRCQNNLRGAVQKRSSEKKTWLFKLPFILNPTTRNLAWLIFHAYLSNSQGWNKLLTMFPPAYIWIFKHDRKTNRGTDFGAEAKGQTRNMLRGKGQNHMMEQQQPYTSTVESRNQCFPPLFWPYFTTAAFVCLVSCHSSVIALPRF